MGMVIPRVKYCKRESGCFAGSLCFGKTPEEVSAKKILKHFAPGLFCTDQGDRNVIIHKGQLKKKGEYQLTVFPNQINIIYGDYEGLRNALATLSGLEENGKIQCVQARDYPENGFRSCLLDLARGYVALPVLKEHLVRLAKLKFNCVHLHLMDRQSYILESDVVPNPDNHRQYTKKELRQIVELCNLLSLDAIPEIEFPTHAVNLLKAVPEIACDLMDLDRSREKVAQAKNPRKTQFMDQEGQRSDWAVCIGKEFTYQIYSEILDEIVEIFDSEYVHIGTDEIAFEDLAAFPNWDNCHECKKLMEKYDGDILSVYHHGIRRINEIVKAKGKKAIKWNEGEELDHAIDLPNDMILEYWATPSIDNTKKDIERFISLGYQIINAQHQYTYVDLQGFMTAEKINGWTPSYAEDRKNWILGGEMCAWELGNPQYAYYAYTLPVCMALFSDRVWNSDVVQYDAYYTKSLFASIIGSNLLEDNPLKYFQDIIPPRQLTVSEEFNAKTISACELQFTISELKAVRKDTCYGKIALQSFIRYLEKILCAIQ